MLVVHNLTKHFPNKTIGPFSFELHQGEILFIAGKSGEGKSTVLKMLTGLLPFDEGEIRIDNNKICLSKNSEEKLWKDFRERYGIVFQYSALLDSLNIFENIALKLLEENKLPESEIRKKVEKVLELTELDPEVLSLYPSQISGGMQKRVAFARAILHNPEYLFLDEPTSGLDPILASKIDRLILKINKETRVTTLIVSHDVLSIKTMATKVLLINHHKPYFLGTLQELRQRKHDAFLRNFFFKEA